MAIKLKSLFRDQQFILACKALLFWGALGLMRSWGGGIIPMLLFVGVMAFLSVRSRAGEYVTSIIPFLVLFGIIVAALPLFERLAPFAAWGGLLSGIFYLLLGVNELAFVHRAFWYGVAQIILTYFVVASFFLSDPSTHVAVKLVLFFALNVLLLKDFFSAATADVAIARDRILYAALILGFLGTELAWALRLLPLHPLNAATVAVFFLFIGGDIILQHFHRKISFRFLATSVILFASFTLFLFFTSGWRP